MRPHFVGLCSITLACLADVARLAARYSHRHVACANTPPNASKITAWCYANGSSALSLRGADPNGDPIHFRIVSLPINGTIVGLAVTDGYQAITSPDQELRASSRFEYVICTPLADVFRRSGDAFRYVAAGGELQSAPALVVLNLLLPPPPALPAGGGSWTTNDEFSLRFTGDASAAYRVFASAILVNWEPLGLAKDPESGQLGFRDVPPANRPVRFHRPGAS